MDEEMDRMKDSNEMASKLSVEKERMEDEMRWNYILSRAPRSQFPSIGEFLSPQHSPFIWKYF